MCQKCAKNEDIVAIDAKLVGSGDQRCTLFEGWPQMWSCLFARAVFLRRAARSTPAVFDFNQVKNWVGA
jgi:hypothetical protein